jgi:xylose isomerase
MLGSVDCNTGDELLGWDTDQFNTNERQTTTIMKTVIKMGGFRTGGLNFDAKVRRESTSLDDLFIAHIGSMDAFAKGLINAVYIIDSGKIPKMVANRYASWSESEFAAIESGKSSFDELESIAKKLGQPKAISGRQGSNLIVTCRIV